MHRSRTLLTNQISAHHRCHLLSPSSVYQEIIQPSNRCQLEPMGALGLIIPNTLFDWAYLEHSTGAERTGTAVAVDNTLVFIDVHSTVTGGEWQLHARWCPHIRTKTRKKTQLYCCMQILIYWKVNIKKIFIWIYKGFILHWSCFQTLIKIPTSDIQSSLCMPTHNNMCWSLKVTRDYWKCPDGRSVLLIISIVE